MAWCGLDGTQVPLYLHQPIPREMTLRETLAREVVLGRLSAPPLIIDLPDMIALDDAWIEERRAVDFVTLDQALTSGWENTRPVQGPPVYQLELPRRHPGGRAISLQSGRLSMTFCVQKR